MKLKSKNSFLKRISCIALSLMLCLTSFTLAGFVPTVEAEAADTLTASELTEKMKEFEDKFQNGKIYTNISNAYTAYVEASKAYDSYYYGGDTSIQLATYTENLNKAINSMNEASLQTPSASVVPAFGNGNVASGYYSNVLYSNGVSDTDMVQYFSGGRGWGGQDGHYKAKLHTNKNIVLLYDAINDTSFPITLEGAKQKTTGATAKSINVKLVKTYVNNNSPWVVNKTWQGTETTWNYWPTGTNYMSSTQDDNNTTTQFGSGDRNYVFGSSLKYTGSGNDTSYYEVFDSSNDITLSHVMNGGVDERTEKTHTLTPFSSSNSNKGTVYVINYAPIPKAYNSSDNKSKLQNVNLYKEGGLQNIVDAYTKAVSFNLNKYVNSSKNDVTGAAGQIKSIMDSFKGDVIQDDPDQYPALRKAMDNAMSTYKAGRGNYTYRSYNQFKTAYEFAQTVMQNVITWGYVDGSFAETAAENLTTAYNNLETPKANITFENLFSFEDFYDSNSAGKGGLTSASFDRANKTIAFEGTGDVSTVHGGENLYMIPVEPGKTYRLELDVEASDDYSLRYCDVMAFLPNEAGTSYDENHVSWRGYSSPTWKNDSTHKSIEFTIPADYPTERSKIFFRFGAIYDTENNDKRKVTATYKNIVFYDVEREAERGNLTDLHVTEISVTPGQKYGDLPSPTREGYVFDGWYTDKEFTNQVTSDSIAVASQTAVNLYAKWHAHNFKNQITMSKNGNIYTWNGECTCGETQELSKVDASAYLSAVEAARTDIANTVKYSSTSIADLQKVLDNNTLTFENEPVLYQADVEKATNNIIYADQIKTENNKGVLELATYTVTFNTVNEDKTTEDKVFERKYAYGSVVSLKADGVNPYKWTRDGDNLVAGSTDEFTLVVTGNTVVNAYYYSQTAPENQHVVTVYNRQGKIIGCFYVDDNARLTVEGSTISCGKQSVTPEKLPFYQVTGYTVEGGAYADGYAVTSDIKVYAKYSPQTEITITLDNTNANIYFENDSSKSETTKTVVWDKKVTVKSERDVIWLVDGKAVAKGPSYTFRASNSIRISTQEIATESPSSVITYAAFDAENNKARIAVSNYSSDNFRIKEQGIIFGTTTNMNPDLTVKQLAEKGKKYVATKTTDTGNQFSYTLTFTSTTKKMLCVISYVTYNDNTTVYSDRVTYVTIN